MTTAAMLTRRRRGATLQAIADEAGLSRQAVEQRLSQVWPGHSDHAVELRRRRTLATRARAERERVAALPRGPCAVCGRETTRRPIRDWICSVRCGEEKRTVRWRWAHDPAYREAQSARVASWCARNRERVRAKRWEWLSSPERQARQREYHRAYRERRKLRRATA